MIDVGLWTDDSFIDKIIYIAVLLIRERLITQGMLGMFHWGNTACSHWGRTLFSLGTHNVLTGDAHCCHWGRTMFSLGTHTVLTGNAHCSHWGRTMFSLGTRTVLTGDAQCSHWGRAMFSLGTHTVLTGNVQCSHLGRTMFSPGTGQRSSWECFKRNVSHVPLGTYHYQVCTLGTTGIPIWNSCDCHWEHWLFLSWS